jgi:hypothetical protein
MEIIKKSKRILMTPSQKDYENILERMATIRACKVHDYGESRYNNPNIEFNYWMCFSDIHRKYIRLENIITKKKLKVKETIGDTLLDMANYCIMMFQIIEKNKKV